MENAHSEDTGSLSNLALYLFTRREAILTNWRTACEQDPLLQSCSSLSREEFNDLIPVFLNTLEQRILGKKQEIELTIAATGHGLQRWQKAYGLLENMRELNHLTTLLLNEIQAFQVLFPQTDAQLLVQVQAEIAQLMNEAVEGSVQKYDELQRLEAANRAVMLQQALNQMQVLSRQRSDMLRVSSHDLRGSFGIINTAFSLLNLEGQSEQNRDQYVDMLNRNLTHVQTLLNSLMDLARLEAGEEVLQIQSIDAAGLLQDIVDSAQPLAQQRGLSLRANGLETLPVETDPVKLQRIVQNLLLNAIQYTPAGFVSISWSREDDTRWLFSIQDSGPGLQDGLVGLLAKQLRPTVESTASMGPESTQLFSVVPISEQPLTEDPAFSQQNTQTAPGEGVGLQIVKRLCELLKANLDVETQAGRGTLFRVRLPIHQDTGK